MRADRGIQMHRPILCDLAVSKFDSIQVCSVSFNKTLPSSQALSLGKTDSDTAIGQSMSGTNYNYDDIC